MPPDPSPEIESVVRRMLGLYAGDFESLRNLMSSDPSLRVLGSDRDEWWKGPAEFLAVRETQTDETPEFDVRLDEVEGFVDGNVGWATVFQTMTTAEGSTPLRHTVVLRLEAGVWRVIHLHNSSPVANQQIFGVDLTKTLDDLVTSILEEEDSLQGDVSSEGTVTLVFTDIVDSTTLAESVGDNAWAQVIGDHEAVIDKVTTAHGGRVVKFLGDGSMLAFDSARAAVRSAIEIQKETTNAPFSVRIGVHTGEVKRTARDLYGLTVNKAARVAAATNAGGVTISSTTRDLVGPMDGVVIGDARTIALKGMSGTHQVVPIEWN